MAFDNRKLLYQLLNLTVLYCPNSTATEYCETPMRIREHSRQLIPDPPQEWVDYECPKCKHIVKLRFEDDYLRGKVVIGYR